MKQELPVFMQDPKTYEIFKSVASSIPKGTDAYIVGGAVRNALYYSIFKKRLPQRDYDIVCVGNQHVFIKNLRNRGFSDGKLKMKTATVLTKRLISKPKDLYLDYVVLDFHFSSEKDPLINLKKNANFTINGSFLPLKYVCSLDWKKHLIQLPDAMLDIKKKKLKVNAIVHPTDLFACMRFMSQGFKQPSKKEVKMLLGALIIVEKEQFQRNVTKLCSYVGGEEKARKLLKKLDIKENIFDFDTLKQMKRYYLKIL